MRLSVFWGVFFCVLTARAQAPVQVCTSASTFSPCDLVFEVAAGQNLQNAQLDAEFRSPTFVTYKMPAFWDGSHMVVRFSATEAGAWAYRTTSNVTALNGQTGDFIISDSSSPGFLQVDNTRAWSYTAKHLAQAEREAHLWMGFQCPQCLSMDRAAFDRLIAGRAGQSFNHASLVLPLAKLTGDVKVFADVDARIRALHEKGIFSDIAFAENGDTVWKVLATPAARERFVREAVAHFAAFRITWNGVSDFETGQHGRDATREIGLALKKYDPYNHPRSTGAAGSSSGLNSDGWMTHIVSAAANDQLGSIESQVYPAPRIAADPAPSDADFTRRLWNATMNGQYPSLAVTNEAEAKAMAAWYEMMSRTRFWELEPYFDVDGGRALYLTGIEYIVYIDKPGTIDVLTEKKGYQVYWMNVATGVIEKQKKDFKGERFSGQPPGPGAWVLHLSRDGRKEGLAKSYHFESRRVVYQEVESNSQKVPFEIAEPKGDAFEVGKPVPFAIKLTRESRATREMAYLLTAEATVGGQGARVLATGPSGTFSLPDNLAANYPAVVNLHLLGRNANGKVYAIDRVIRVTK